MVMGSKSDDLTNYEGIGTLAIVIIADSSACRASTKKINSSSASIHSLELNYTCNLLKKVLKQ